MKVWRVTLIVLLSANHSLPIQADVFEIQEKRQAQTCNIQITDHLSDMGIGECADYFRIDDHGVIND